MWAMPQHSHKWVLYGSYHFYELRRHCLTCPCPCKNSGLVCFIGMNHVAVAVAVNGYVLAAIPYFFWNFFIFRQISRLIFSSIEI